MSSGGREPKMPRLLTRMSAAGTASRSSAAPCSVARSQATVRSSAAGSAARSAPAADSSRSRLRPVSTTRAPAPASPVAMERPMPWDDPVTTAVLPARSIRMARPFRPLSEVHRVDLVRPHPDTSRRGTPSGGRGTGPRPVQTGRGPVACVGVSENAGGGDGDLRLGGAALGAVGLDLADERHAVLVGDLAEHHVLAVQPGGEDGGDEELRPVGVRAGVGHREQTRLVVLQGEVLVGELLAVDALATGAVAPGEVTALEHEVRDDAVERRAGVTEAVLTGGERAEVLRGLGGNVVEKVEHDPARGLVVDGDVEIRLDGHGSILTSPAAPRCTAPARRRPWAARARRTTAMSRGTPFQSGRTPRPPIRAGQRLPR